MKNIIEFFYNIKIDTINKKNDYYILNINNKSFIFKPYNNNLNIESTHRLNNMLKEIMPINNIIPNKYNSTITKVDNNYYILIEDKIKSKISLPTISNISNTKIQNINYIKNLERNNWEILWGNKIDYYELQIKENKKKYPLIRESFDYFIGMSENAITYLVNTKLEEIKTIYDEKVPSHISIHNSLFDPTNIILDHKARDLGEYIKYSFWNNNNNIFKELNIYFKYNYYSPYGIRVLYSRILYPSFYFDLYDQIITNNKNEKEINKIIYRINEYEQFLHDIYLYLNNFYNIPEINYKKTRN